MPKIPPARMNPNRKARPPAAGPFLAGYSRNRDKRKNRPSVQTRAGTRLFLRKPLAAGGLYRERRRPRFWRSLSPALAGGDPVHETRLNGWLLVLAAKKIPYIYSSSGDRPRLYVPPLYEGVARHEISAFEQERSIPVFIPPKRDNIPGVLFFLLLLVVWHGLRWGWFDITLPSPPFPENARAWAASFGLDAYRTTVRHEWWRAITALTLHADELHVFSNAAFGLIFLGALCRRAGLGLGIALAVLSGITGNACNALTKEAHAISIGFSTALFGALGSLCALAGADVVRHLRRFGGEGTTGMDLAQRLLWRISLPLAAGAALLGLLGGGGEARTDYPAHIWGFCCGVLVCLTALPFERKLFALPRPRQAMAQAALLAATLGLLAGAWWYAL